MYTTIRDAFYGYRAGDLVAAACIGNDCSCKALHNYIERPLGSIYFQITVVLPNGAGLSFEVTGENAAIDAVVQELHAKSVLFSAGKVEVTTEGKFSTVALGNCFSWKNYMLA